MGSKNWSWYALELRVEELRNQKGWSLSELAKRSGVSKSVLSDIKRRTKTTLNYQQEIKLSQCFGVEITELYTESS